MSSRFDRLVYFYNPKATNASRAEKLYSECVEYFDEVKSTKQELFGVDKETSQKKILKLAENFNSKTLVLVGGGDGTVNFVIETIISSKNLNSVNKRCVFLPLWGGNANDLAVMLNGVFSMSKFQKVLDRSTIKLIKPLSVEIESGGSKFTKVAINYASFGMTAHAIKKVEQSSKQSTLKILVFLPFRIIAEVFDVLHGFFEAKPFEVEHQKTPTKKVSEILFINGSRIAKIDRFPSDIFENKFFVAISKKSNFFLNILRILFRPKTFTITSDDQWFLIKSKTMAQIDGETLGVDAGSQVNVGLYGQSIYVLSSRQPEGAFKAKVRSLQNYLRSR